MMAACTELTMNDLDKKTRVMGMLAHLVTLVALLGIPFSNLVAAAIFWLVYRGKYPFVDEHGKEAVNFIWSPGMATAPIL